ncbi:urate hydroxylase PuuD [Pseudomonas aeruginosa]|uniref:urate hydroxylase PuuD n=1 Tax=Pseudomonas aeruginosa TaxID=287 RepID=UPI0011E5B034|nr:urate hydroxylase PuuD [Pseudomonas aeruginosa]
MEAHLIEWLNLLVRWIHMIVGIAWIGASFYFVWLENNLNRSNPREGLSGDLWAIHGGGIYHLEKYKLAPPKMPENLHWFKWEAYSTWMSGVVLLTIVFYLNPTLYLIAPGSDLAPAAAIAIGIGSLVCGWFVYTILCDSALGKTPALLGLVLFVLLVAAAYGLTQVFSGRGAYLHVGAIIGTIMVGNVFRVIMPAQRALVKAIEENREPDPVLPAKGLLRSRHNNYFTLPVLFIMISNHFPSTYGSQYNWLILAAIAVLAVLVRHYFNTDFDKVHHVIQERCTVCHSAKPTSQLFSTAPGGIMLDTPQQIQQLAPKIQAQAVASQIMPLGNITQMTQEERNLIGSWIAKGAQIN